MSEPLSEEELEDFLTKAEEIRPEAKIVTAFFAFIGLLVIMLGIALLLQFGFTHVQERGNAVPPVERTSTGFDVRGMQVGDRYKMCLDVVYLGPPEENKGVIYGPTDDDPLSSKPEEAQP